jgi:hypothetical protein
MRISHLNVPRLKYSLAVIDTPQETVWGTLFFCKCPTTREAMSCANHDIKGSALRCEDPNLITHPSNLRYYGDSAVDSFRFVSSDV